MSLSGCGGWRATGRKPRPAAYSRLAKTERVQRIARHRSVWHLCAGGGCSPREANEAVAPEKLVIPLLALFLQFQVLEHPGFNL